MNAAVVGFIALSLSACQWAVAQVTVPFATGEWQPLVSEKLPDHGAAAELIAAISKAGGIKPTFEFLPWARAEAMVSRGEVFAAFPYAATPERREKHWVSDSFLVMQARFIAYKWNAKTPATAIAAGLEEIRTSSVGAIRGSHTLASMTASGYTNVTATPDVDKSILMLKNGRLDFLAEVPVVAFDSIKRILPDEVDNFMIMDKTPFAKNNNVLIVSKTYPHAAEILVKFNNGLAAIKKSGEYQKLLNKYHLTDQ